MNYAQVLVHVLNMVGSDRYPQTNEKANIVMYFSKITLHIRW